MVIVGSGMGDILETQKNLRAEHLKPQKHPARRQPKEI
jgi:hypothetical protein